MYFDLVDNINFNGFITDENDLEDLKIIEYLSNSVNNVLFLYTMLLLFSGYYLLYKII